MTPRGFGQIGQGRVWRRKPGGGRGGWGADGGRRLGPALVKERLERSRNAHRDGREILARRRGGAGVSVLRARGAIP